MFHAHETAVMTDQMSQQVISLQTLLRDKQHEVDAYKEAVEQSDTLLH